MTRHPRKDPLAFIDVVRGECAATGTRLRIHPTERIHGHAYGYFDHSPKSGPVLEVAAYAPFWLGVLAHEFAHLQQWRENPARFDEPELGGGFDEWLEGATKRLHTDAWILSSTRALQRLELDAERRAIRLIREFHLLDDVARYVRASNLYVWKYEVARRIRRWPTFSPPLQSTIERLMPDRLMVQRSIGKPPAVIEENAKVIANAA